jgi:predicted nucleic acid-binding protein
VILDASAAVDLVLDREPMASWVRTEMRGADRVRAPHVIDPEVLGAIRRFVLARRISAERGRAAIDDFAALPIVRFPHRRFLAGVWALRDNVAAADGFYVVLADVLGVPLVTTDASLARAPGLEIEIRAFA